MPDGEFIGGFRLKGKNLALMTKGGKIDLVQLESERGDFLKGFIVRNRRDEILSGEARPRLSELDIGEVSFSPIAANKEW